MKGPIMCYYLLEKIHQPVYTLLIFIFPKSTSVSRYTSTANKYMFSYKSASIRRVPLVPPINTYTINVLPFSQNQHQETLYPCGNISLNITNHRPVGFASGKKGWPSLTIFYQE